MNIYTVRKASAGLAAYIENREKTRKRGVAIAYDSRHKSPEFAMEAAKPLLPKAFKHTYLMSSARRLSCLLR